MGNIYQGCVIEIFVVLNRGNQGAISWLCYLSVPLHHVLDYILIMNWNCYESGELQRMDLTGNQKLCQADNLLALSEFQHNGEPIMLISSSSSQDTLYDDDP